MNILFDLSATQPVTGNDFHGGSEYAKTVFFRLCDEIPTVLEVFYNPLKKIDTSILEICKNKGFVINFCRNNSEISALLCRKKFDVFYSALPYLFTSLTIPPETRFIYTVHGLRPLEFFADKYDIKYKKIHLKSLIKHILFLFFPALFRKYKIRKSTGDFNRLFSLTNNQTIITVSDHSKYAIAYFFPLINTSGIKVFYSPLKQFEINDNDNTETLGSFSLKHEKYILLTGGDRNEKGAYRACRVLYNLIKNDKGLPEDIKVIILGVSNHKAYRKLTNNNDRFEFRGYVSTGELETLYKNARLFLYPTLNEGFGYPPLEAMKYGILCACSANSAITEIYGNSVLYFNPFDETEMGIRILQSFDENIRREKSEIIKTRYKLIRERQEQDLDSLVQTIIQRM